MKTGKWKWQDWSLLGVSLLFILANRTFLAPCAPKEDGSLMHCHGAGEAVFGVACLLLLISVIRMFFAAELRRWFDLAIVLLCIFCALIPGVFVTLCMMPDMRCHVWTRPGTIVFSVLLGVLAAISFAQQTALFQKLRHH